MATRTNELSTDMALNIMMQHTNSEVSNIKYSIQRLEDMLRNQKVVLEDKKARLARIKEAQLDKSFPLDALLNL